MPNHIDIAGGRPTGQPENWNEAEQGKCATLSVLYGRDEQSGHPIMISAWRMTPAELQAMQRDGTMFLQIYGEQHPVIALWIQDAAGEAVELDQEPVFEADLAHSAELPRGPLTWGKPLDAGMKLSIGLGAAYGELEAQAEGPVDPTVGELDDAGQVFINGTIDLKAIVEAVLEMTTPAEPASGLVEVPIMTLETIGLEGAFRHSLNPARKCRECGCSQINACRSESDGPCWWIGEDLCSHCGNIMPAGVEHPAARDPNAAVCPACSNKNSAPIETLSDQWRPLECSNCERDLEVRAIVTGPEMPDQGGYAIECRRAG